MRARLETVLTRPLLPGLLAIAASSPHASSHAVGGHPRSMSRTRIEVSESGTVVDFSFQALSLIEAIPNLDADEDLELSGEELEAGRAQIAEYLGGGLRLWVEGGSVAATGTLVSLEPLKEALAGPGFLTWWRAGLRYDVTEAHETFEVESLVFREGNPLHADVTEIRFGDDPPFLMHFMGLELRQTFEAARVRRPAVRGAFFRRGAKRFARALEHPALLFVLLLSVRGWRNGALLFGVLLASQALAYFLAGVLLVQLPAYFIALATPLSVAYIGTENLMTGRSGSMGERRIPYVEAVGFGLLHGLALHLAFEATLGSEPLASTASTGYFLGATALATLAFALIAALVLHLFPSRRAAAVLSAGAVVLGLWRFAVEAGWLRA